MQYSKGLEGVIAAESTISLVDGENGQLVIRGHTAKELALKHSFEEVAYLIWYGKLPTVEQLQVFTEEMKKARNIPPHVKQIISSLPKNMDVMSVLRTALSSLGDSTFNWPPTVDQAMFLTSIVPSVIAFKYRRDHNETVLDPNYNYDHVQNYLYMLSGKEPNPSFVKALNAYLILTMEHGMNASTFASRVVASSESEMISSICAAVGAMKGPLHGGAPSEVIKMLDEIGEIKYIESWLRKKLEGNHKIMGFGHRVYKAKDPRAEALKIVASELSGESSWFDLAILLEQKAIELLNEYKPGRKLYTNVEFYAAAVLKGIELPDKLFTATFTSSRMVGWTAHVLEQASDNRIFRPQLLYNGQVPK